MALVCQSYVFVWCRKQKYEYLRKVDVPGGAGVAGGAGGEQLSRLASNGMFKSSRATVLNKG